MAEWKVSSRKWPIYYTVPCCLSCPAEQALSKPIAPFSFFDKLVTVNSSGNFTKNIPNLPVFAFLFISRVAPAEWVQPAQKSFCRSMFHHFSPYKELMRWDEHTQELYYQYQYNTDVYSYLNVSSIQRCCYKVYEQILFLCPTYTIKNRAKQLRIVYSIPNLYKHYYCSYYAALNIWTMQYPVPITWIWNFLAISIWLHVPSVFFNA